MVDFRRVAEEGMREREREWVEEEKDWLSSLKLDQFRDGKNGA